MSKANSRINVKLSHIVQWDRSFSKVSPDLDLDPDVQPDIENNTNINISHPINWIDFKLAHMLYEHKRPMLPNARSDADPDLELNPDLKTQKVPIAKL